MEEKLTTPEATSIQKTEEIKPVVPSESIGQSVINLIQLTGTVEFSEKQIGILFSPIDEETIEIRPDGLIYLPWMEYKTRLRDAFGGKCAMIPATPEPKLHDNLVMWGFYLFIDGKPYAFAYGEQAYQASNPTMTWGDAIEGAKSNALMRLCKDIGIGLELWKPSFIRAWKEKYAEKYYDEYKRKQLWRKKQGEPIGPETKKKTPKKKATEPEEPQEEPAKEEFPESYSDKPITENQMKQINAVIGTLIDKFKVDPGILLLYIKEILALEFNTSYDKALKIPEQFNWYEADAVIKHFREPNDTSKFNKSVISILQLRSKEQ